MKRFFTKPDVVMLKERQELKKRLKALNQELDPKVAAACDELGDGAVVIVGSDKIKLQRKEATTVSWKSICESVAEPDAILEIKPLYTVERITRKAEVAD